jgi:hypothetical protein
MSAQILEAIEIAVPGITHAVRFQPPTWIEPLEHETAVWLGGINITHVEVTAEWNEDNSGLGRVIVNALTDESLVAQATITVDRESQQGTFHGWKIVRLKTITSLAWQEHTLGGRKYPQVTATFEHLEHPVLIPGEVVYDANTEKVTELFRLLREPWIDSGLSERATQG